MEDKQFEMLLGRIEQLERIVSELKIKVDREATSRSSESLPSPQPSGSLPQFKQSQISRPVKPDFKLPANMKTGEYWLNKFGIGLILFGVAFGFKYSVDQGWLTPIIRIVMGLLLGAGLMGTGWWVQDKRPRFSLVLYGGAIAVFYITGFAAFQLFDLVSHTVAFAFMLLVTIVALIISIRQNSSVLSIIGALGGLGTPFLLYTEVGNIPGLVTYTCLLLAATGLIYLYKGWRSLLTISIFGGMAVLMIGVFGSLPADYLEATRDRAALQIGLVFFWLLFWIVPVLREMLWKKDPSAWPLAPLGINAQKLHADFRRLVNSQAYILPVTIPLLAFANSISIWDMTDKSWGWISLAIAFVYGMAAWYFSRDRDFDKLRYVHILTGSLFFTLSLPLLLDGDTLFVALTSEALIFNLIALKISNRSLAFGGHALYGICFIWLLGKLFVSPTSEMVILNSAAAVNIFPIISVAWLSLMIETRKIRLIYLMAAHLFFLGWLASELSPLANGQGFITISWVIYGVTLVVLGLKKNIDLLRWVALATLLLAVLKLFIIDLAQVRAIWRVLMSVGFGGLFLLLSYFFRNLWRGNEASPEEKKE